MEKNIWFELSKSQLNIWDLEQRFPGTPMNAISCTVEISGKVDFQLLTQVLNEVILKDDSLRLIIHEDNKVPMQSYMPYEHQQFEVFDFTLSGRTAFEKWQELAAREPISVCAGPLYRFSLFRLGEFEGGVLVRTHHIISDGWTQMQLCNRIATLYMDLLEHGQMQMEQQPSYQVHIQSEEKYLGSFQKEQDDKYWSEQIAKPWEPANLKQEKGVVSSLYGQRTSFGFTESLNHKIYHFCMENRVSPFSVYYLALAAYLNRSRSLSCFSIGVPVFNRVTMQERKMTGMFVSTLPFICDFNPELSTLKLNEVVAEQWFDLLKHQRMPMHELQKIMQQQANDRDRMFDIALSYEDTRMLSCHDASIRFGGAWYYSGYQAEQLCIHLHNRVDERHYQVDYDFQLQLFSEDEIEKLHMGLEQILDEMLSHPETPINELDLLPREEQERVLYTFNQTETYLPQMTLREKIAQVVDRYPQKAAVIYDDTRYTYEALYQQAKLLAEDIEGCLKVDEPVIAVLMEHEYNVLLAMVAAMIAGCPWVLIPEHLPEKRIQEILEESRASVLITKNADLNAADLSKDFPVYNIAEHGTRLRSQENSLETDADLQEKQLARASKSLAYIVYTSGTTGKPKGVAVTQTGLLNFAQSMDSYYGNRGVLSVCNISFDAFIIESASALLAGRTIVMAREDQLQSPMELADLIRHYGVGFMSMTPSRLKAWMTSQIFCEALRDMQTIICGGEAFPSALVSEIEKYSHAKVYNQYGPSEATVGVSMKQMNQCQHITIGKPMPNCRMYVLNEKCKPLPVGARGTLFLGGKCLADGYYRDKVQTDERFVDNPFEWKERMYNTGDEAAWTEEGEIVLFGRTDNQIKLRGLRIDLLEIIGTLQQMEGIYDAHVKLVRQNEQDFLAAYYVSERPVDELVLRKYLSENLPGYMVPSFYVWMQQFAMTDNGKIDEKQLPLPQMEQITGEASTRRQKIVLEIFAESLHVESFGMDNDYFRQGGNSLGVMEVISHLNETFGVRLKPSDMYAYATPRLMEQYLTALLHGEVVVQDQPAITKAPVQPSYPMSATQQNMYVHCCMNPDSLAYHMPGMFAVEGGIDINRLQQALDILSRKDDILRTGFRISPDGAEQVIFESSGIQVQEITAPSREAAVELFLKPFDLSRPPLVHCGIWTIDETTYLMIDIHHIIGDGLSTPLFLKRLSECYLTGDTEVPEITFKDYAYWKHSAAKQEKETALLAWEKQLKDMPELLLLPTDKKRTMTQNHASAIYVTELSDAVSDACSAYCRQSGCSEYVLFAAAFGLLLQGIGQVNDLIVGTPLSGREMKETLNICGPFVNTLPLRMQPQSDLSVAEYISQVNKTVGMMLDHQSVSLEDLIAMKHLQRTAGGNPMYQILFSMRPMDAGELIFADAHTVFEGIEFGAAKMDLSLEAAKENGKYKFAFEYVTALFEEETIAYYGRCLSQLIAALVNSQPLTLLSQAAQIPAFDQLAVFEEQNETCIPFSDVFVDRMIEKYSQRIPDCPAVIWHGQTVTYQQLNKKIDKIADLLRQQGAGPGTLVGLVADRTPDMLAAMVGILKTGAAYVPALITFPSARLKKMEQISQLKFWACDSVCQEQLETLVEKPVIAFDQTWKKDGVQEPELFIQTPRNRKTTDPMYVLFTSGSTGEPKGIIVTHRGVHNLSENIRYLLEEQGAQALCTTNMVFDTFYTETLLPLRLGKTVVLADQEEMMLPFKIGTLIKQYRPSLMQMTPSRLNVCLEDKSFSQGMKYISKMVVAGEALTLELVNKFKQFTDAELINLYGPAEASVYATGQRDVTPEKVTIGKPLFNCRCYCLDENRQPVPPTAVGELYLAGECLGDGYIHREDLNEENFFEDCFSGCGKMYRTRDLVRYRLDGNLDFVGRVDFQVKLNGQRLEPDEIAMVLRNCPLVGHAVVIPVMENGQTHGLRAFYELSGDALTQKILPKEAEHQMKEQLEKELPSYMMPSEFICLKQVPMNASGKADRRALMNYSQEQLEKLRKESNPVGTTNSAISEKVISEKNVTEKAVSEIKVMEKVTAEISGISMKDEELDRLLLSQWKRVLKREQIERNQSFFEQGGTSLTAMQLLSCYYDNELTMTMEQFYQYPVYEQQVAFFAERHTAKKNLSIIETEAEMDKIQIPVSIVKKSCQERERIVLLTGATGYLGAHLLAELLRDETARIICLVRVSALKKLYSIWTYYFGKEWTNQAIDRVQILPFNLLSTDLGLSGDRWKALTESVTDIYHCAADVRHFAIDGQITKTNVEGTRNMLRLACAADAVFHHISTLSVCGTYLRTCPEVHLDFEEDDFEIGQNWQDNEYVRSKFKAEKLVYQMMDAGLRGKIYRVGTLVGRNRDGVFQMNPQSNAFFNDILGMKTLQCLPQQFASRKLDLTPIDYCAAAIAALARSERSVFHVMGRVYTLQELCENVLPSFSLCSEEAFETLALTDVAQEQKKDVIQLRELLARFKEQEATITPVDEKTRGELEKLGFEWQFAAPDVLLKEFNAGGDRI